MKNSLQLCATSMHYVHQGFFSEEMSFADFLFQDGEWKFRLFGKIKDSADVMARLAETGVPLSKLKKYNEMLTKTSKYEADPCFFKSWVSMALVDSMAFSYNETEKNVKAKPKRLEEETFKKQIQDFHDNFVNREY